MRSLGCDKGRKAQKERPRLGGVKWPHPPAACYKEEKNAHSHTHEPPSKLYQRPRCWLPSNNAFLYTHYQHVVISFHTHSVYQLFTPQEKAQTKEIEL